jgi:hypothetical protein
MSDQSDVRRIALSLPGSSEARDRFAFCVARGANEKDFAWVWLERVDPRGPRLPQPAVVAIRTADLDEKQTLIASDPEKLFTEDHYNGFPAVLVRLAAVDPDELEELLVEGWRAQAPRDLVRRFDAGET